MDRSPYKIVLRDCGSVGHLGIVLKNGKEVYRTGKHWPTPEEASRKCIEMLPQIKIDHGS